MKSSKTVAGEAMSNSQRTKSTLAILDAVVLLGGPKAFVVTTRVTQDEFVDLISGEAFPAQQLAHLIDVLTSGEAAKADLYPFDQDDDLGGIDVSELVGSGAGLAENDGHLDTVVNAVIAKLHSQAWERVTQALALHDAAPSIRNKGAVVAAFNHFAALFGAESV